MGAAKTFLVWAGLLLISFSFASRFAQAESKIDTQLLRKQQGLFGEMDTAEKETDFPKLYELIMEMRDLTLYREQELKMVGVDEIDYIAADFELALDFSVEQMELAEEEMDKTRKAILTAKWNNHVGAIDLLRRSLEICNELYGAQSYKAVHVRLMLANAICKTDVKWEEGVEIVSVAAKDLEEADQTNFRMYAETQLTLTRLYVKLKDHERAVVAAQRTFERLQAMQLQSSSTYVDIASVIAAELNQLGRHEEAIEYAMKGRLMSPPEKGENAEFYFQLLLQSARAKVAMEKPDEALRDYSLLVFKSEQDDKLKKEDRLPFLQEYAELLKKNGDEDRLSVVQRKIDRINGGDKDEVQFTGEKSRYSN